jgi:hypothetical protein
MRAASNPAPGFVRNPDKRITVAAHAGAVEVSLDGTVIASSKRAKLLTEAPYPPAGKDDAVDAVPLPGGCQLLERQAGGRKRAERDVGL